MIFVCRENDAYLAFSIHDANLQLENFSTSSFLSEQKQDYACIYLNRFNYQIRLFAKTQNLFEYILTAFILNFLMDEYRHISI